MAYHGTHDAQKIRTSGITLVKIYNLTRLLVRHKQKTKGREQDALLFNCIQVGRYVNGI